MLHDSSKTQNYCRSGPVKFEEKSRIDNSIRNHRYCFQSNTHLYDEFFCLIRSFFDGILTCYMIVQKLKIIAVLDL